ncbi:MAG: hypothetical protein FD167_1985 [bacterium]|nr:MAG: hypothetical protein FD167_1985 [bacterium]
MDSTTDITILDIDSIEIPEDGKQYYLIETFKQEQLVGAIQEEKIGSSKFIRVDVPDKYGITIDYSKYLAVNTLASMTPIAKATAIKLVKNILSSEPATNRRYPFIADGNVIDNITSNTEFGKSTCEACSKLRKSSVAKPGLIGQGFKRRVVCLSLFYIVGMLSLITTAPDISMGVVFGFSVISIGLLSSLVFTE